MLYFLSIWEVQRVSGNISPQVAGQSSEWQSRQLRPVSEEGRRWVSMGTTWGHGSAVHWQTPEPPQCFNPVNATYIASQGDERGRTEARVSASKWTSNAPGSGTGPLGLEETVGTRDSIPKGKLRVEYILTRAWGVSAFLSLSQIPSHT